MPEPRPTGRPLCADARRNREMIIAAAEDLFLRGGASASLEEIARRAGMGSATLHRHFPTASTCRALRDDGPPSLFDVAPGAKFKWRSRNRGRQTWTVPPQRRDRT